MSDFMNSSELSERKAKLRREATIRRAAAFAAAPASGETLIAPFLAFLKEAGLDTGAVISAYWPLPEEMDLRPLMRRLHDLGYAIGLPVVLARGAPLVFRRWSPDTPLVQGNFRVMTPPPGAPEIAPDCLLVPLLAFDPRGYRLGYGGGFYDRTLAKARENRQVRAIGAAYAAQEMADLPIEAFDQPLDGILTEQGLRLMQPGSGR